MRILFIDSDPAQGFVASAALSKNACTVDWVRDALSAQGAALSHAYDWIVLDVKTLHDSDLQIEDLGPFGRSNLLMLNDLNWSPGRGSSGCQCGCSEPPTYQALTISELLDHVRVHVQGPGQ